MQIAAFDVSAGISDRKPRKIVRAEVGVKRAGTTGVNVAGATGVNVAGATGVNVAPGNHPPTHRRCAYEPALAMLEACAPLPL